MKQVITWRGPTGSLIGGTYYYPFAATSGSNNVAIVAQTLVHVPISGTFRQFCVSLSSAPGAGTSWTFTLYVDGVASALSVVIADAETTGSNVATDVAITAGQKITMLVTRSGVTTLPNARYSVEFESETAAASFIATAGSSNNTSTNYAGLLCDDAWGTTQNLHITVIPTSGTITRLDVYGGPTISGSRTFTILKNGTDQDGTGGTPDTRITLTAGGAIEGSTTFSLPVVAGDQLMLRSTPTGAQAVATGYSIAFDATVPGESIMAGGSVTPNSSADQKAALHDVSGGWTAGGVNNIGNPTTFGVRDLYWLIQTAPGAGNSWTFTVRVNDVDTSLALTIADAATSGSNLTDSITVVDGDTLGIFSHPVSSPTAAGVMTWSAVQFIANAITGSAVFGVTTTVTATRAIAFGLDGATNTHGTAGMFKVFGDMDVTGTVTFSGTLSVLLDALEDVSLGSPVAVGDVLTYDGAAWVNTPPTLAALADVTIGSPLNDGDHLVFDGSAWTNTRPVLTTIRRPLSYHRCRPCLCGTGRHRPDDPHSNQRAGDDLPLARRSLRGRVPDGIPGTRRDL